jgi:hypothetical protein
MSFGVGIGICLAIGIGIDQGANLNPGIADWS